ncbi:MAG: hypothetical protein K8R31_05725 [Bacteroidales bacterium]|nr:hypothetical protein [Bacteroidales bacterium]
MGYTTNITIKWTYPKEIDSAYESDESYGRGIYQITRRYGKYVSLLYIGIVKGENRDFYERLDEHWHWLEATKGLVKIRFGKILPKQGLTITEEMIETIEGAIIIQSEPKWNEKKINSYTIYKNLEIYNIGYRGFVNKIIKTKDQEIV